MLWKQADDGRSGWRGGVAVSSAGPRYELDIEGYFDTAPEEAGRTRFGLAGSGEYRVAEGIALVATLATLPETTNGETVPGGIKARERST